MKIFYVVWFVIVVSQVPYGENEEVHDGVYTLLHNKTYEVVDTVLYKEMHLDSLRMNDLFFKGIQDTSVLNAEFYSISPDGYDLIMKHEK